MFAAVFPVIAPVMICALIGFLWARSGQGLDANMVGKLVTNIGAPCLVVSTLTQVDLSLSALTRTGVACLMVLGGVSATSLLALRLMKKPVAVYLPSLVFANIGNMGLPLCLFAFGEEGLALALAWFMANVIIQFSLGVVVVSGGNPLKALLTNPIIGSVVIALLMIVNHWELPLWLANTVDLLAGFTIPLMLIMLGVTLSTIQVSHLADALLFSILRIGLGFGLAWLVTEWLALEGVLRGVVLIQASMPSAVFNYLFAQQYRKGVHEVASMIMVSTILSFLVLPFLVAFAMGRW